MGCFSSKELRQEGIEQPVSPVAVSGVEKEVLDRSKQALMELLASNNREYLVDRSGKKVKLDQLKGYTLGLLFSAHAVPTAREFIRLLAGVHKELKGSGKPFEVVFLSNDESLEIWKESMKEMPWLAVPFLDRETGDNLGLKYGVADIPTLVVVDMNGNKLTGDGVDIVQTHGSKAWPFTIDRLGELKGAQSGRQSSRGLGEGGVSKSVGYGRSSGFDSPRDNRVAPEDVEEEEVRA